MAKLSSEEKAARKRQRMIDSAKKYRSTKYSRQTVAPLFQRMIRAEFAAEPSGECLVIKNCKPTMVHRDRGECACVTCGDVQRWDGGIKGMHTGHFIASRRNSILFDEDNVAPQCSHCNYYRSGEQQLFRQWMMHVRGEEVIQRLAILKVQSVSFTIEQLVDMRLLYDDRLKAAIKRIAEPD